MNGRLNGENHGNHKAIHFVLTERFLSPDSSRWSHVEQALFPLRGLADITQAHVILERPSSDSRYRAMVWLTVPGPDLHAEESDYTVPAALQKAVASLVEQIRRRTGNRSKQRAGAAARTRAIGAARLCAARG